MPAPAPTVGATSPVVLAVAGLVGAGLAWIGVSVLESFGLPVPPVPWLTPVAVAAVAVALWLAARWMHRTVQIRREPVEPSRAVGLLLGAKAALIGGTALAGAYAAVALRFLPYLDAALPRERVWASSAAAIASVLLALAAWFLERACQIPPPDDDSDDAPSGDQPAPLSPG